MRVNVDEVKHKRTRACELLNWAKSRAYQPRQENPELRRGQPSPRGIENPSHIGKYFANLNCLQTDGVADNCHIQTEALLTTVTFRLKRC